MSRLSVLGEEVGSVMIKEDTYSRCENSSGTSRTDGRRGRGGQIYKIADGRMG